MFSWPVLLPGGQLGGDFADHRGRVAHAGDLHRVRRHRGQPVPEADLRGVGPHAVEDVERAPEGRKCGWGMRDGVRSGLLNPDRWTLTLVRPQPRPLF